jgi:sugar lactone lactonase YvrE
MGFAVINRPRELPRAIEVYHYHSLSDSIIQSFPMIIQSLCSFRPFSFLRKKIPAGFHSGGILAAAVVALAPMTTRTVAAGLGQYAEPYTFETLAGNIGYNATDGLGSAARFFVPFAVAVDGSGNVYVADQGNHTIRKITAAGMVTTLAGQAGSFGSANGAAADARFNTPVGVAVDGSGNVYVADKGNQTIRKITAAGQVTTFAGTAGVSGSTDSADGAPLFNNPWGVAVDGSGNVYVADSGNNTIRKITPAGVVTTLAGQLSAGSLDGTGAAAQFFQPKGVAVDASGTVYVADSGNHTIRKITAAGVVTTLAGQVGVGDPTTNSGSTDGSGSAARFNTPTSVAVDDGGNVYVADRGNHAIRKITATGEVTTLAGTAGSAGTTDGAGTDARFSQPSGVALDGSGALYVADTANNTIRKIVAGAVTTLAGLPGGSGSADGTSGFARFNTPYGVAVDSAGNSYVADTQNHTIRKITAAGVVTTLAGQAGVSGAVDGTGTAAQFNQPGGVAVDGRGTVYVADTFNHSIRMITPGGVVTTVAGLPGSAGSSDGTGAAARFNEPYGVAVDGDGVLYVADTNNYTIRKIAAGGVVSSLSG